MDDAPQGSDGLPPGYFDQPVLVIDPGRHTARIWWADADETGRVIVTSSEDRTVRIWSLESGAIVRTIRLPSGPGDVGKAYAVAIDPRGELIAAGGWTAPSGPHPIYLYACETGHLIRRIDDISVPVIRLVFSPNGRYLVAALSGSGGIRVFDRDSSWAIALFDATYRDDSYGVAFAPDGTLATTSLDGLIHIYSADFKSWRHRPTPGGQRPYGVAFSPDSALVAVGYADRVRVDLLDRESCTLLRQMETCGIDNGDLSKVAWRSDGTLLAAGSYRASGVRAIVAWPSAVGGPLRSLPGSLNNAACVRALADGDILLAASDPWLGRLRPDGRQRWCVPPGQVDFRGQQSTLGISSDGQIIAFIPRPWADETVWFDVAKMLLTSEIDGRTAAPRQSELPITDWFSCEIPKLGGRQLPLDTREMSRSLAIQPDGNGFVLGTEWSLRCYDMHGTLLWRRPIPGIAWAVNITGDGRLVVAAYADGTIRWHRMDDGREILAFMPLADRSNWVAWTPEGFYAASPGARGVLRWHVNRPDWQPADAYPVADIPGFHRPDVIPLVLKEMETERAIGLATIAEQRRKVRLRASSRIPPGARRHVLSVGVSRHRHAGPGGITDLWFAHKDATDIAHVLGGTECFPFAAGTHQCITDDEATRQNILRALTIMRGYMAEGDLAVFFFAGHGEIVDDQLYLFPHDVEVQDDASIKSTALGIAALLEELLHIAKQGRVLVLVDTCYSGGTSLDRAELGKRSRQVTRNLAEANITVLTSSSVHQASSEHPAWENGAFTEAVLEALSVDGDLNNDGLISPTEFANYVVRRVRELTDDAQVPEMEVRFDMELFAVRKPRPEKVPVGAIRG